MIRLAGAYPRLRFRSMEDTARPGRLASPTTCAETAFLLVVTAAPQNTSYFDASNDW
jgi:hypothetical protein